MIVRARDAHALEPGSRCDLPELPEEGKQLLAARHVGWMLGEAERALMQRIKLAFDPNGILNPGKGY